MDIQATARECHQISSSNGFWDEERNDGECIALMTSELSEALEAFREGNIEGVREEFADAIIRILDFTYARGWDISNDIRNKMDYNKTRPYKHGKVF